MIAGWRPLFLYNVGLASVVAVAQLVESQIVILVVVGSSPIGHPTEPPSPRSFPRALPVTLQRIGDALPNPQ
jgi:hypothetical protein